MSGVVRWRKWVWVSVLVLSAGVTGASDQDSAAIETTVADTPEIVAARQQATTMHELYAVTLDVLHHRYFHRDKSVLPARAMQDIFDEIERQRGVEAKWISASLKPMSIDHAPADDFERRASKEIAAGKADVEQVVGDKYRRALAIPLTGGCLSCHEGLLQNHSKKQFAGLVISVPLEIKSETGPK